MTDSSSYISGSRNIVRRFSKCEKLEELYAVFDEEVARLGFDYFSMAVVPLDPKFEKGPLLAGTFPDFYLEGYQSIGADRIDPYLELSATRLTPFFHHEFFHIFEQTEIGRKLIVLAEKADIIHGYGIPFPSVGMARIVAYWGGKSNSRFYDIVAENEAYLTFLAVHFAAAAEELGFAPTHAHETPLTKRECDVLLHMANGLLNVEIGKALGITERTVRFHFSNIVKKLGTERRSQTLVRAVRLGLIDFS